METRKHLPFNFIEPPEALRALNICEPYSDSSTHHISKFQRASVYTHIRKQQCHNNFSEVDEIWFLNVSKYSLDQTNSEKEMRNEFNIELLFKIP